MDPREAVEVLRALQMWIQASGTEQANEYEPPPPSKANDAIDAVLADRMKLAYQLGSPKDADRLSEILPLVLASYRQRAEAAEAKLAAVVGALEIEHRKRQCCDGPPCHVCNLVNSARAEAGGGESHD